MSDPQSLAHGRYLLVQRLGEGGMATVYRAFDQRLQVWRAVKVLLPEYARKKKILQRFDAEAQTMALLEHPNIVRVYDVGVEDTHAFIVMELVEGGSLVDWLEAHGRMPPRLAVDVIVATCQALQFAHAKGVIHRDLKPHNIMVDRDGVCRLTDFGIARAGDSDEQLTKTGAVMGTWGFMAPEQRTDAKHVDARADVYAIAATLFSLLTDRTPMDLFLAEQDASLLEGVPEALVPVLVRATDYKRERRYASAQEFAAALLGVRDALPEIPEDTPPLKRVIAPLPPPPRPGAETGGTLAPRPTPPPAPGRGETLLPTDDEVPNRVDPRPGPATLPPGDDSRRLPTTSIEPSPARPRWPVAVVAGVGLAAAISAVVLLRPTADEGVPEPAPSPVTVAPEPPAPAAPAVPAPGAPEPAPASGTPAPAAVPRRAPPAASSAAPIPPRPVAEVPAAVAPPAVAETPPPRAVEARAQCFDAVTAPTSVARGEVLAIRATTCKDAAVVLHYRPAGSDRWFAKNLPKTLGKYSAAIQVDDSYADGVEWYLSSDGTTYGDAGSPKRVKVSAADGG